MKRLLLGQSHPSVPCHSHLYHLSEIDTSLHESTTEVGFINPSNRRDDSNHEQHKTNPLEPDIENLASISRYNCWCVLGLVVNWSGFLYFLNVINPVMTYQQVNLQ